MRRWSSRIDWLVSMLATLASASNVESSGFSATVKVPENSVKRPRTLVPIRWRATKPASAWAGSTVYVPGLGRVMGCVGGHWGLLMAFLGC